MQNGENKKKWTIPQSDSRCTLCQPAPFTQGSRLTRILLSQMGKAPSIKMQPKGEKWTR